MAVLAFDCRRIWCWEDAVKVTTTCPVRNRKQPNSLPNQSRIIRTPHLLSSAARPKLPNCPASLIQISKYTLNAASFSLSISININICKQNSQKYQNQSIPKKYPQKIPKNPKKTKKIFLKIRPKNRNTKIENELPKICKKFKIMIWFELRLFRLKFVVYWLNWTN